MTVTPVRRPKCRSKKHHLGGCGDPRCPEGLHVEGVLRDAVAAGSLNDFFTAKEQQRVKVTWVSAPSVSSDGWLEIAVSDPEGDRGYYQIRTPVHRSGYRSEAAAVDKADIPEFDDIGGIEAYARATYDGGVYYDLVEDNPQHDDVPWTRVSVAQITIDADLRGLGIASHLRSILIHHADTHGKVLSGTPTNKGDGLTKDGQASHVVKALAHRDRLAAGYLKAGYVHNPLWRALGNNGQDWLTKEYYVPDLRMEGEFTPEGQRFLHNCGMFVRFPNGEVPKGMLRRGSKFSFNGYERPASVPTQDAVYDATETQWREIERRAAEVKAARAAKKAARESQQPA